MEQTFTTGKHWERSLENKRAVTSLKREDGGEWIRLWAKYWRGSSKKTRISKNKTKNHKKPLFFSKKMVYNKDNEIFQKRSVLYL